MEFCASYRDVCSILPVSLAFGAIFLTVSCVIGRKRKLLFYAVFRSGIFFLFFMAVGSKLSWLAKNYGDVPFNIEILFKGGDIAGAFVGLLIALYPVAVAHGIDIKKGFDVFSRAFAIAVAVCLAVSAVFIFDTYSALLCIFCPVAIVGIGALPDKRGSGPYYLFRLVFLFSASALCSSFLIKMSTACSGPKTFLLLWPGVSLHTERVVWGVLGIFGFILVVLSRVQRRSKF